MEVGVSERQACKSVGIQRSTQRHTSKKKDDSELRNEIVDIATASRRFGYRRITWLLQRAGIAVNPKRVYRIYCEENLQVRKRKRKKVRVYRKPLTRITTNSTLIDGFRFRQPLERKAISTLNVIDEFTRECLAIEVDFSLPGKRVARVLDRLVWLHGRPEQTTVQSLPEKR